MYSLFATHYAAAPGAGVLFPVREAAAQVRRKQEGDGGHDRAREAQDGRDGSRQEVCRGEGVGGETRWYGIVVWYSIMVQLYGIVWYSSMVL